MWFDDGTVFKGTYVNGVKQGDGIYQWSDGSSYEGQLKDNVVYLLSFSYEGQLKDNVVYLFNFSFFLIPLVVGLRRSVGDTWSARDDITDSRPLLTHTRTHIDYDNLCQHHFHLSKISG